MFWKWNPVDVIVLIVAVVLGIIFVVMALDMYGDHEVNDAQRETVAGLIGTLIAILVLYVGNRIGKEK